MEIIGNDLGDIRRHFRGVAFPAKRDNCYRPTLDAIGNNDIKLRSGSITQDKRDKDDR